MKYVFKQPYPTPSSARNTKYPHKTEHKLRTKTFYSGSPFVVTKLVNDVRESKAGQVLRTTSVSLLFLLGRMINVENLRKLPTVFIFAGDAALRKINISLIEFLLLLRSEEMLCAGCPSADILSTSFLRLLKATPTWKLLY